jgi:uncharacterized protein YbjT (DUF2867 family)
MSEKLIAVAGVTGNTGSAAAQTLLERGARVRVLVRSEEKGGIWTDRGAEVAVADLTDPDSLAAGLEGADGAYLLGPPDEHAEDFLENRRLVVDAARSAIEKSGIPHVVYLSSIAAQHAEGTGVILSAYIAEQELGKLETATTFIRAAYFMENAAMALQSVTGDGVFPTMWSPSDMKIPQVATLDIGRTAAEALLAGPKGRSHCIELAGPEDLSADDVAGILSDLLGRDVSVAVVPPEAQVAAFSAFASQSAAEKYYEMFRAIESGLTGWEGGDAQFVRGTTTIREVLSILLNL